MPGISTLADDFNDNTVNTTLWPNNYGTYQEAGGRARVACDTGFNAYKSATSYSLTGSSFYLHVYAPAAAGAATSTCTAFITTTTAGTDAGFLIDTAGNAMGCYLRAGFADAGAVFLTYSATDHAWLRLRESAGTLYWDTSPDGTNWTNRRTATTPAWAANTDLALYMDSHRDAGTNNWAEYDNLNTPPVQTIALGTVTETGTAQAITVRKTIGLGRAAETSTAIAPGRRKVRAAGTAAGTEQAVAVTVLRRIPLTPAAETSTAPAVGRAKTVPLSPAASTETVLAATAVKTINLGRALVIETAVPPTPLRTIPLNPATEVGTVPALGRTKTRRVGTTQETDTAIPALLPGSQITHRLRLTGTPATTWHTHGTTTAWACIGRTTPVDALSTEYYEVGITWDRGTPTSFPVDMAIVAVGHEPGSSDWHPAVWDTASSGTGTVAKILVGPDGVVTPLPGRYRAWVRVTAPPELPVLDTAPFDIS
ncbi:hypothetical protein [Kitasatospora sp. NPDC047058]|uniref:hypothetical protein n=1 Tax=Kitasatospora sp. NPDC047058 TaxID=3155620 RepID=UPI0033FF2E6C